MEPSQDKNDNVIVSPLICILPSNLPLPTRGESANPAIFWQLRSANACRFTKKKEKRKPLEECFSSCFLEKSFHNITNPW